MKFVKLNEPVPHIVIQDFLTENEINKCIAEFISLRENFYRGTMLIGNEQKFTRTKNNFNLHLYDFVQKNNLNLFCVNLFQEKFWNNSSLRRFLDDCGELLFSYINDTNKDNLLLSSYQQGDYYRWHKDIGLCTTNVFINNGNVEGGEFVLSNGLNTENTITKKVAYKCTPGNLIIFPSRYLHCVTKVKNDTTDFRNSRFTLQNWALV